MGKIVKNIGYILLLYGGIFGLTLSIRESTRYLLAVNEDVDRTEVFFEHYFSLELIQSHALWSLFLTLGLLILIKLYNFIESR